jgi:hypothetical protein
MMLFQYRSRENAQNDDRVTFHHRFYTIVSLFSLPHDVRALGFPVVQGVCRSIAICPRADPANSKITERNVAPCRKTQRDPLAAAVRRKRRRDMIPLQGAAKSYSPPPRLRLRTVGLLASNNRD